MDLSLLSGLDLLIPTIRRPAAIRAGRDAKKDKEAHDRAVDAHAKTKALRGSYQELGKGVKRKVSDVIAAPVNEKSARAEELLNLVVEQRGNLGEICKLTKTSLLEQFNCGLLPQEQFDEELRDIVAKERKLNAGDVTIDRNRDRVLRSIQGLISQHSKDEEKAGHKLGHMFLNILAHKSLDRTAEQKMFRHDLIGHYECQPGGWKSNIWCPVYKKWYPYKHVKAAHLVPFKLDYQTMGDLFGEEGRGHQLMWSMGNGMMLHRDIEAAYDKFDICFVPVENPGQQDGWKLILVNEGIRLQHANAVMKWDHYDGMELQFLNDQRPSRRFLYFHYFFCIYKAIQERTPGWQKVRERSGTRQLWATPGPYLRASMLKKLSEAIGDTSELPDLLEDFSMTDPKPLEEKTEKMDAKDLASVFLANAEFKNSDEDEESEDSEDCEESD